MILCMNCGKLETYKVEKIITSVTVHNEDGSLCEAYSISTKNSEPKCPKCGRDVKFFKDVEEVESEDEEE